MIAIFLTLALGFSHMLGANDAKSSHEIISKMIEAHGGMEKWRSAPAVSFEDHFTRPGEKEGSVSQVTVEQGRRRAYLDFPKTNARITWDGKRAWSENWKEQTPPRFLALLNYYFLNLPWLTMDQGVNLTEPEKVKLWDDPTEYITVKVTFDAGVGDTPEDYYLLYIDPKTYRLKATEYIVTYASLLPPDAKSTPPHILVYDTFTTVDGLVVPSKYSIYEKDRKPYAACEIRNWSFKKPFDTSRMTMPPGAVVDTTKPTR